MKNYCVSKCEHGAEAAIINFAMDIVNYHDLRFHMKKEAGKMRGVDALFFSEKVFLFNSFLFLNSLHS